MTKRLIPLYLSLILASAVSSAAEDSQTSELSLENLLRELSSCQLDTAFENQILCLERLEKKLQLTVTMMKQKEAVLENSRSLLQAGSRLTQEEHKQSLLESRQRRIQLHSATVLPAQTEACNDISESIAHQCNDKGSCEVNFTETSCPLPLPLTTPDRIILKLEYSCIHADDKTPSPITSVSLGNRTTLSCVSAELQRGISDRVGNNDE